MIHRSQIGRRWREAFADDMSVRRHHFVPYAEALRRMIDEDTL